MRQRSRRSHPFSRLELGLDLEHVRTLRRNEFFCYERKYIPRTSPSRSEAPNHERTWELAHSTGRIKRPL